jgi:hypothetical protein
MVFFFIIMFFFFLKKKLYEFLYGIRAYHKMNEAHTTYLVTKTIKNTGLYVREGVEQ